jgi:primosomal protein N' (replication factor Y)
MPYVRVAVSGLPFAADRVFTYALPAEDEGVQPGVRVLVPFGRGNRRVEAFVLSLCDASDVQPVKPITERLDDEPVLDAQAVRLALWMRERYFCSFFEAARAMLPAGLWHTVWDESVKRKVSDKHIWIVEPRDVTEPGRLTAVRQTVLDTVSGSAGLPATEVCALAKTSMPTLRAMEKSGLISLRRQEVYRTPDFKCREPAAPVTLTPEQGNVYQRLSERLHSGKSSGALLHGVTGSGKTSVYIKLAGDVLERGGGCIILVPEIALTAYLMDLFVSHFGDRVAVLHSGLGVGQRYDEWKRIRRGEAHIVLGTRSAVFAPVQNLRLIIMDEEQEHTYKSEESPRYHAREVAKRRTAVSDALFLMGSATPSVESMHSAREGHVELLSLTSRYNKHPLPEVLFADMKEELRAGNGTSISRLLAHELERTVSSGEQAILFMGRRGYNRQLVCGCCGCVPACTRCSVSLTVHRSSRRLLCHYCGYAEPLPDGCRDCGQPMRPIGTGTQRVEEELGALFPGTPVLRMDADTTGAQGAHSAILRRFRSLKIPILLGTQMVTKGLDFPDVTLVGVLSADQALYTGDVRGNERAFSLIAQVVGRAGRGVKPGRAVLQTFTPSNPVLMTAAAQNYNAFFEGEIALRYAHTAPPFADWTVLTVSGIDEDAVLHGCLRLRAMAEDALNGEYRGLGAVLYGPAPAYIVKVNNRYRYRITLCSPPAKEARELTARLLSAFPADKRNRGLAAFADVNPEGS